MKDRLEALAEFLPIFETPDFEFGRFVDEPGTFGYYSFSEDASRFIDVCYETKWVNLRFDWGAWTNSLEALRLRDDPAALESATPDQLQNLLTVVIRQDRFVEGALASAFESGLLVSILRRAGVLAEELELQGSDDPD